MMATIIQRILAGGPFSLSALLVVFNVEISFADAERVAGRRILDASKVYSWVTGLRDDGDVKSW